MNRWRDGEGCKHLCLASAVCVAAIISHKRSTGQRSVSPSKQWLHAFAVSFLWSCLRFNLLIFGLPGGDMGVETTCWRRMQRKVGMSELREWTPSASIWLWLQVRQPGREDRLCSSSHTRGRTWCSLFRSIGRSRQETHTLSEAEELELQNCRIAELQNCRIAELQNCRIAELQNCSGLTLHLGIFWNLFVCLVSYRYRLTCLCSSIQMDASMSRIILRIIKCLWTDMY